MNDPTSAPDSPGSGAGDWPAVRALFERLLELPASQRERALRANGSSPAVKAEVRSLLAHHVDDTGDAFLNDGAPPIGDATATGDRSGQRLGHWQLQGLLGRGGMGEVWEAARADGAFEGRAAIKVLLRGLDSAAVLGRFAQEQQALARLNHPHIARLLDAGRTPDWLPYFVMELVEGRPIDQACRGLTVERRLKLFLQLADAVAHAHRNLLVHRDLKPSNVLVTRERQVKLLDFGIAKALDPLEGGAADATLGGQRPFTPHYASPEQVRGEPVSTATDIYSLGVLLYVMLTGIRPYGRDATTPLQAARSVLEDTPTRPSQLSPDQARDKQWTRTRRHLAGDLDNVVMKALAKDPAQRYASVEALAADLRAHLAGYPVSARAPSAGYLLRRFVGRNKAASVAVLLGSLGVLGGLGASLWQARQAAQARDLALQQLQQVKRITTDIVFRYGDTVTTLPGGAKAQEPMLRQTLESVETALKAAPDDADLKGLAASILARLAELQGSLMLADPQRSGEASATTDRAVSLGEAVWTAKQTDWRFATWHVRAMIVQANLARAKGQLDTAAAVLARASARAESALALQSQADARAYLISVDANARLNLAQTYDHVNRPSMGRSGDALREYEAAEKALRDMLGRKELLAALDADAAPGDPATEVYLKHQIGTILGGRALIHMKQENLPAARAEAEAAMQLRRANVEREPRNVAWRDGLMTEANTLAVILLRLDELPAALDAAELSWRTCEALAAEQGPSSKWAGSFPFLAPQYGRALAGAGRHAEALKVYDRGIAYWADRQAAGPGANTTRRLAALQAYRARSMAALGQRAAADALASQAAEALRPLAGQTEMARDALLLRAEALAVMAVQPPARQQALEALRAAEKLGALAPNHARLRDELMR